MFKKHIKSFQYGNHTVTLETGEIARQAAAAVKVSMGDTVVLVAVTTNKDVKEGQDFFPLTVDYFERTYAAGKIPGGFFKREGKQSEKEILTSRLIDRPIRPLFPEGFYHDIQIVAMVISIDPEIDSVGFSGGWYSTSCVDGGIRSRHLARRRDVGRSGLWP